MNTRHTVERIIRANPVPDESLLNKDEADAVELYSSILRRRGSVLTTPTLRPPATPEEPMPWYRKPQVVFLATALLVAMVMVPVILAGQDRPEVAEQPATSLPTTTGLVSGLAAGAADQVFDLALAPDGSLWAATNAGVVRWDLEAGSPTVFSEADGLGGRSVDHVAVAGDGTVWTVVGDSWVAYYDGTWTLLGDDIVDVGLLTPVGDIAAGPDGALWVAAGGPNALIRVDNGGATTFQVPEEGYASPWTMSLVVDPAGTVWASFPMPGVFAYDGAWRHFGVGYGLPSIVGGNVAIAPDGTVWVGSEGVYGDPAGEIPAGGVARFDGSTWTSFTTADGLLSNDGSVAVGPDGDVWVIHTGLPAEVADALDVHLPSGLSHYDGTRWETYPDVPTGYGRGAAVSADGTLWMPSSQGIVGFDGTASRLLVAGPEAVPPPGPPGPPVRLELAEGLEPVRLFTSIGEIEFTTWVMPAEGDPPWEMTETPHGIIGGLPPDGAPAVSLDGVTWTETPLSVEPNGWAAYGDALFMFHDRGVVQAVWDGAGWTEIDTIPTPRLDRGAVGPHGIVAVRGERVYYWDDAGFTEATQPPDRLLHPGPSAFCSVPGFQSEGIMAELGPVAATDGGFIALAARSEADWYRGPVCEPLVWLSTDGDTWAPTSDESPFGERFFVLDMAVVGGRIVAVGGVSRTDAAVWVSDDGITWERADLHAAHVWQVAGGAHGWIAVGDHDSNLTGEAAGDMWFSTDGFVWDGPYDRPPGWADATGGWADGAGIQGLAVLDDRIIGTGWFTDLSGGVVVGVFIDE